MTQAGNTEATAPRPRRRLRWYLGWTTIIVLLALGTAYTVWRVRAQRALDAELAILLAAGEPITIDGLKSSPVPDAENAALPLQAAAQMIDAKSPLLEAYRKAEVEWPLTSDELELLRRIVRSESRAVALVGQARARAKVDWKMQPVSPAFLMLMPNLGPQRELANGLGRAADEALARGDDTATFAYICEIYSVAHATGAQPGNIGLLVSLGMGALADARLQRLLPYMQIGTSSDGGRHPIAPAEVRDLIMQLLDDIPLRRQMLHALRTERIGTIDNGQSLMDGNVPGLGNGMPLFQMGVSRAAARPIFLNDLTMLVRESRRVMKVISDSEDFPAYRRHEQPLDRDKVDRLRHPLIAAIGGSANRIIEQYFQRWAERRLTATALAIRWYACEHDGRLPEKLEDLVPTYLPAVPIDVMTSGEPLKYDALGPKPCVYSVGLNRRDDGGASRSRSRRPGNRNDRDAGDLVVYLTPQPREEQNEDARRIVAEALEADDAMRGGATRPAVEQAVEE